MLTKLNINRLSVKINTSFMKYTSKTTTKFKIPINNRPKYYANICQDSHPSYSNFDNFQLTFGRQEDYEMLERIGGGRYSEVYKGINLITEEYVVIKVLKPIKVEKIKRECSVLSKLQGKPGLAQMQEVVIDRSNKTPTLILNYVENGGIPLHKKYEESSIREIKSYIYQLLEYIDYYNSLGIIHRDIKPQNIILEEKTNRLWIIDWGLGVYYHNNKRYQIRAATRYFKPPELLIEYPYYHYSFDIWSLGCLFAAMIFKKEPFFKGTDDVDQLKKIARILGTNDLKEYQSKYQGNIQENIIEDLGEIKKKEWERYINLENQDLITEESLDLLSQMLVYDHNERISPKDALNHPFFNGFELKLPNQLNFTPQLYI